MPAMSMYGHLIHYFSIPNLSFVWPIGVTGNALESDVNKFLNAGADSVLIKPFMMDEFTSAMASVAIRMAAEMPTPSVTTGSVLGMLSEK